MPLSTNFITIPILDMINAIINAFTSNNTLILIVDILDVPTNSLSIFDSVLTFIGTIVTVTGIIVTASIMVGANKISEKSVKQMEIQHAQSIEEMKKQYEQTEKNNQLKDDKKELKDYIDKHLLSEYQQIKLDKKNNNNTVTNQSVRNFNFNVLMNLKILYANSAGLFYADSMAELISKIRYYDSIVLYPDNYSDHTQTASQDVFFLIITTLYKSLINKKEFKIFNQDIKTQIDVLEKQLTDKEKKQLKKDNEKRP